MPEHAEKRSRCMTVVYNCDDAYCCHTAVSIASLLAHNAEEKEIRIYVLGNGIRPESLKKLQKTADAFGAGRSVRLIPLSDFAAHVQQAAGIAVDAGKFTITALARIFAAELLPKEEHRALYLDCDTLILRSLRPLYELELSGRLAAMAMEPSIYPQVRAYLGLPKDAPYFNAGMMLMDLDRWRREDTAAACMAAYREAGGSFPFSDQDCLNKALMGRVRAVSQRWNFLSNYVYQRYTALAAHAPWFAAYETRAGWRSAKKYPAVVHFAGDERPWIVGNFNPYRRLYAVYLEKTPYCGTPRLSGKRLYMLAYHGMNLMTAVLPGMRWRLSQYYYRKQIERQTQKKGT